MPTNERYGRFKVKKIKKRMISAVLALSMGMTMAGVFLWQRTALSVCFKKMNFSYGSIISYL